MVNIIEESKTKYVIFPLHIPQERSDLDKSLSLHVAGLGNGGAEIIAALLLAGAEINEPFIQQWHLRIRFKAGR